MQPKTVALAAFLLPIIAINGSYVLSASYELVPWCIPYLEGCTSISRSARRGNSIFIFRALMLPYSVVLIVYWTIARGWLRELGDRESMRPTIMMWVGIIGALFLILYVDFLGTEGRAYRAMRRYGVIFFFACTGFAELLFVSRLYAVSLTEELRRLRKCKVTICLVLLLFALLNIPAALLPRGDFRDAVNNLIEWNFGLFLALFSIVTYFMWARTGFVLEYKVDKSETGDNG